MTTTRIFLGLVGIICLLVGVFTLLTAETIFQQIAAAVFILIAIVCVIGESLLKKQGGSAALVKSPEDDADLRAYRAMRSKANMTAAERAKAEAWEKARLGE